MIPFAIAAMQLLATTPPVGEPRVSADVGTARFEGLSLADGLESCLITLRIRKGWHVYASPSGKELAQADAKAGVKREPKQSVTFTIEIGDKTASINDVWYPPGVVKTAAEGNQYRAYESEAAITVWLLWEETQNAQRMTARVRVVATDGKRRLPESVIEVRNR